MQEMQEFDIWDGKIPWRRAWQPTPVFLPGGSHGQRSLAGYSLWDCKEPDTAEWACTSFISGGTNTRNKKFGNMEHLTHWKCLKVGATGIPIYNAGSIIPVTKLQLLIRNSRLQWEWGWHGCLLGVPVLTHPGTLLMLALVWLHFLIKDLSLMPSPTLLSWVSFQCLPVKSCKTQTVCQGWLQKKWWDCRSQRGKETANFH